MLKRTLKINITWEKLRQNKENDELRPDNSEVNKSLRSLPKLVNDFFFSKNKVQTLYYE